MTDALYLLATIGFFLLMLGYLRACAALGQRGADPEAGEP